MNWLVELIQNHQSQTDRPFCLALSGGSTPQRLYELLAALTRNAIDWTRIVLIWGDERNVSQDDPQSNYRMVQEALLSHIEIPAENVLAVPNPSGDLEKSAVEYETLLRSRLDVGHAESFPSLDCVLLGLGDDVHTASLFPNTLALEERVRWVVANQVPQLGCWRLTLSAPLINAAKQVAFLVAGPSKTAALQELWHGPRDYRKFPAQLIVPASGKLTFFLDQAAIGSVTPPLD